ncbi:MAG TPA: hypothetical protein VMS17_32495 [Gemmataceae bacterium]|nr:hypothetical protein [Gemmataceae bacterium]
MNPLLNEPPRRPYHPHYLAALAALLVLAPAAWAVGGDGIYYSASDSAYFSGQNSFRIPFGDVDRRIQEVILYVSVNYGQSYERVTSVAPSDREFRFQARGDGWYWFTVQTRDSDNRLSPPDLSLAQPQIKVCVDTRAPTVTMRWLPANNGMVGVEWEASDTNLDVTTLRVDYRAAGGDWQPLPIKQTASGSYSWNPGTTASLEARIQVQDKAHNPAEYKTPPSGDLRTGGGPAPVPGAGTAPPPPDGPANPIMVNSKRFELNFKIDDVGSSKVKAVEVWYTQDGGRSWQKKEQDAQPDPPYIVSVEKEGLYGITLIARSGVGLALPPPKAGDPPQVWVQVDVTKPKVNLVGVEVGRGPDTGYITVRWNARDEHMAANPITISYADASAGENAPWQVMVANTANSGQYVWRMPEGLPPQILVRVEAIDQAGNIGQDQTVKPISTDLSIPKARVIDVHPAQSAGGGAMPPP